MPGTLVGMGLNSPRISLGASGFISKVSRCEDPPLCHTRMQEISLLVPARSTLSSVIPSDPSEPRRSRSRRPKRLVWLFTFIAFYPVPSLTVGQDGILQPVVNRLVANEQSRTKSADAIGAQDSILPHNFSQLLT